MPDPAPGFRPSARVLLFDARDRLLLLRWVDPRLDVDHVWIAPGGGVEAGESWEQAAARELREETGLAGVPLGPCVWERTGLVPFVDAPLRFQERFFVARVDAHVLDASGMEPGEADHLDVAHWWSADELAAATDARFAPRALPSLVPPLIAGDYPPAPLALGL
jgi:8-oxo-dGTP pyrophosphatase MutT (NUDIX family)